MLFGNTRNKSLVSYLSYLPKVTILSLVLLQAGCGGGGGSVSSDASTVTSSFAGSVGDGPIVGATVKFYDKEGQLVHSTVSDQYAKYAADITTSSDAFPLTIEVDDGIDLVTGREPDFTLTSVIENADSTDVNVNPYSTMITETARHMKNGLTRENISQAKSTIINKLNFGLDGALVADPITTKITDDNVAVMTKSSEALGEMIRRVKSNLAGTGAANNENDVVQAFARDLSDGVLDGAGAKPVNTGQVTAASASGIKELIRLKRIAAMYRVTSAQVLIESMSNNLKVDGGNARKAIDDSIVATNPNIKAEKLTGRVRNNSKSLRQVRNSVKSAQNLTPSAELSELSGKLDKVSSDSKPEHVEKVIPPNSGNDLDEAIAAVSVATGEQLQLVIADEATKSNDSGSSNSRSNDGASSNSSSNDGRSNDGASRNSGSNDGRSNDGASSNSGSNDGRSNDGAASNSGSNDGRSNDGASSSNSGSNDGNSGNAGSGNTNDIPVTNSAGNSNTPPVLSGSPQTSVLVGSDYAFQPVAGDADGDNLRFSITNKPAWMTFNTATGRLSGRPSSTEAGKSYSGIRISVSDGKASTSLNGFSIAVKSTSSASSNLGSISLSWTAPVARADGKPLSLSEIAGYTVYYGTKAGNYPNALNINNPGTSSTTIVDLPVGTYYMVMTTRDTTGSESNYSGVVTKQAQ